MLALEEESYRGEKKEVVPSIFFKNFSTGSLGVTEEGVTDGEEEIHCTVRGISSNKNTR